MANPTSRWFLWMTVAALASGCLAERTSTADLKAAADAQAGNADAILSDGLLGEDAADDSAQDEETAGDIAVPDGDDPGDAPVEAGLDAAEPGSDAAGLDSADTAGVDSSDTQAAPDAIDAKGAIDAADSGPDVAPVSCAGKNCDDGDSCTVDTCDFTLGAVQVTARLQRPLVGQATKIAEDRARLETAEVEAPDAEPRQPRRARDRAQAKVKIREFLLPACATPSTSLYRGLLRRCQRLRLRGQHCTDRLPVPGVQRHVREVLDLSVLSCVLTTRCLRKAVRQRVPTLTGRVITGC